MGLRENLRRIQATDKTDYGAKRLGRSLWRRYKAEILLVLAVALACAAIWVNPSTAHAAPTAGLTVICDKTSSEGKYVGDCNADLPAGAPSNDRYDLATSDSLVRVCTATLCDWNDHTNFVYRKLRDLPAYTDSCSDPLEPGTREPNPWSWDTSRCKNWKPIPKAGVLLAPIALTGSVALYWAPVLTDINGAAISGVLYNVYQDGKKVADSLAVTTYVATNLTAGVHTFEVAGVNAAGEGAHSAQLAYTQQTPLPALPSAPTGLRAVAVAAYDLVKGTDILTVKQIGTVPAGTACNASVQALGYYGVPRAKVTLLGTATRPQVVLAKCGS